MYRERNGFIAYLAFTAVKSNREYFKTPVTRKKREYVNCLIRGTIGVTRTTARGPGIRFNGTCAQIWKQKRKQNIYVISVSKLRALIPPHIYATSDRQSRRRRNPLYKWLLIGRRIHGTNIKNSQMNLKINVVDVLKLKTVLDSCKLIIGLHSRRVKWTSGFRDSSLLVKHWTHKTNIKYKLEFGYI